MKDFYAFIDKSFRPKGIPISADLFGMTTSNSDDLGIGQILGNALIHFDYVAPMIYPSHYPPNFNGWPNPAKKPYDVIKFALERGMNKATIASTSPNKLRPWLQDFGINGVPYTPDMVREQIKATYDVGLTSWMMWNASNNYSLPAYEVATSTPQAPFIPTLHLHPDEDVWVRYIDLDRINNLLWLRDDPRGNKDYNQMLEQFSTADSDFILEAYSQALGDEKKIQRQWFYDAQQHPLKLSDPRLVENIFVIVDQPRPLQKAYRELATKIIYPDPDMSWNLHLPDGSIRLVSGVNKKDGGAFVKNSLKKTPPCELKDDIALHTLTFLSPVEIEGTDKVDTSSLEDQKRQILSQMTRTIHPAGDTISNIPEKLKETGLTSLTYKFSNTPGEIDVTVSLVGDKTITITLNSSLNPVGPSEEIINTLLDEDRLFWMTIIYTYYEGLVTLTDEKQALFTKDRQSHSTLPSQERSLAVGHRRKLPPGHCYTEEQQALLYKAGIMVDLAQYNKAHGATRESGMYTWVRPEQEGLSDRSRKPQVVNLPEANKQILSFLEATFSQQSGSPEDEVPSV
jgi:hypothetical protein